MPGRRQSWLRVISELSVLKSPWKPPKSVSNAQNAVSTPRLTPNCRSIASKTLEYCFSFARPTSIRFCEISLREKSMKPSVKMPWAPSAPRVRPS